jgi:hypothetical protein
MWHENSGSFRSRFLTLPTISKPGMFTTLNEYRHARIVRQAVPLEPQSRLLIVPSTTVNGTI